MKPAIDIKKIAEQIYENNHRYVESCCDDLIGEESYNLEDYFEIETGLEGHLDLEWEFYITLTPQMESAGGYYDSYSDEVLGDEVFTEYCGIESATVESVAAYDEDGYEVYKLTEEECRQLEAALEEIF